MLKENPLDIACIGIGENDHIAFNDPHIADFSDALNFKKVDLDYKCRKQQVKEGCFNTIEEVPKNALTVAILTIFSAHYIYCVVPGKQKSDAVAKTINGPINEMCPASILRCHQRAQMYLDLDSAQKMEN